MKKWYLLLIFLPLIPVFVQAAPYFRYEQTILPITDSKWELGTTTKAWLRVFSDEYCLTGDSCITAWPGGAAASFSTTSADYWVSTYDKGYFFSTTSADAWKSLRNFHSTTSVDYWETTKWRWSTTSSDYWETQQWRWATTSATYHLGTFDKGYFFSTTSAQYFVHSSTTIPKTYTANTWTLLQTFSSGFLSSASSTVNSTFVAATTTTGSLNGNVHVTGWPYAQTSAGLQQALNVCNSNGGGTVYAAPGSYTISSTLNLKSKCVLQGAGPSTVLVLDSGTSVRISANVYETGITDLKVDPSALAAGNTYAIYAEDFTTAWIDNVQVVGAPGFGIFFASTAAGTSSKLWITDSIITGLGTKDVIGCGPAWTNRVSRVSEIFIERNYVSQDARLGSNHKDAINCVAATNVHIRNNHVNGGVLFGAEQQQHINSSIEGNTITAALGGSRAAVGFVIESGATTTGHTVAINNNTILGGFIDAYNNPSTPLFDGLSIVGNTIAATGTATTSDEAAIRIVNVKNANVTGNTIATSTSDCIWATGVASSTFSNNVCGQIAAQAFHEENGTGNQWTFNKIDRAVYADTYTGTNTGIILFKNGSLGIGTTSPMAALALNSGQIAVPSGTVGAPGFAFTSQLSSGLYLVSAGNVGLAAGGGQSIQWDSTNMYAPNSNGFLFNNGSGASKITPNIRPNRSQSTYGFAAPTDRVNVIASANEITAWSVVGQGIGSSTPWARLSVAGGAGSTTPLFSVSSSTSASATSTAFHIDSNGLVGIGTSSPGTVFSVQNVANFVANAVSSFYQGLRVYVSLIIPNAADPTVDATGKIAINTTAASSSIAFHDGTAERALFAEQQRTFTVATTTTVAGTTTVKIAGSIRGITYTKLGCVSTGGTFNVQIGDGSSSSTMHTSANSATAVTFTTLSSNNAFNMGEVLYLAYGTPSVGTIKNLSCTLGYRFNAD